ncbi:MAG: hypothetical protein EON47_11020 [Acetobacteraceae bacterium]|nr:MAG: hypothetical protein EON47_11020 [Acetobacteraceae bacterium]
MKPGPRPTWPAPMAGCPGASGCGPPPWLTTTFIAGLRNTGMVAPMVLDGPINGSLFRDYVEQVLVSELCPGDIVVMDNLGSHKGAGVRATIEAAGANLLTSCPTAPTSTQSSRLSPS